MDIQITYSMGDTHTIVAGATYEVQKGTQDQAGNSLDTDNPLVLIQLPSFQKLPDDQLLDEERNFKAIFIEDIWDITDDLRLTLGARLDSYSDFGDEVSPRVGLTWEFINGYDLKLLYGHAFRAPTMAEIRLSAPGIELDPETTDTYEISLGAEWTSSFSSRVTFYYREIEDFIVPTLGIAPWNWVNDPKTRRDRGVEIEAKYDFGRGAWLAGHYNYHNYDTGTTIHQGTIMTNIRLSRYLNFYADCHFIEGKKRWVPGDVRDDPPGYAIVNATLIAKKFLKGYEGLELRGSVYNLLDKDYTMPHFGPEVPNDWPMPGRNFLIEMKYSF
jgi:iron complex outermembrane receptor protein